MKRVGKVILGIFLAVVLGLSPTMAAEFVIGSKLEPSSIDPHYHNLGPNNAIARHFFDRLVDTNENQQLGPGLAVSWKAINDTTWEFKLRKGVKFHDGSDWNCSVAKLNFDHVLSDVVKERHKWMGIVTELISWTCVAGKFVLETNNTYYPLLQELTYIRPLTFAAASAFARGLDSHPDKHNSCNSGDFGGAKWDHLEEKITCGGLKPIGTGPFKVVSVEGAVFARHDGYWGQVPDIEFLHLKT